MPLRADCETELEVDYHHNGSDFNTVSPITEQTQRKRNPSYKITDKSFISFIGAESNAVTKHLKPSLKLSSDTAQLQTSTQAIITS